MAKARARCRQRTERRAERPPERRPAAARGDAAPELDRLIHERMRLAIVSALAVNDVADLQRAEGAARRHRRQPERARAQARGGRLRRLHQVLRRPHAADRVPADRRGPARARALPRPHGSADPADARALSMSLFFRPVDFTMQSTFAGACPALHVAIIMDGNGRWATRARAARALAGHRARRRAVRRVVEAAPGAGHRRR